MAELFSVVLIIAVMLSVAAPLYMQSRRTAAARGCRRSIATIAQAEVQWAMERGTYTTTLRDLAAASGPAGVPTCGLHGRAYLLLDTRDEGNLLIRCPDAAEHSQALGSLADYERTLTARGTEAPVPRRDSGGVPARTGSRPDGPSRSGSGQR